MNKTNAHWTVDDLPDEWLSPGYMPGSQTLIVARPRMRRTTLWIGEKPVDATVTDQLPVTDEPPGCALPEALDEEPGDGAQALDLDGPELDPDGALGEWADSSMDYAREGLRSA
jgi:hypothetical protein